MIVTAESAMSLPTLVLNKHWMAMQTCTARDAVKRVKRGKALIVHPESFQLYGIEDWMTEPYEDSGTPLIRSSSGEIRYPEIIRNTCDWMPRGHAMFNRRNLWRRDGMRCQYCGKRPRKDEITVDHVVPKSKGGITSWENCVLACMKCNKRKDSRTLKECGMKLRMTIVDAAGNERVVFYEQPVAPQWNPLYAVHRDSVPVSWLKFMKGCRAQEIIDTLYWDSQLEP